MPGTSSRPTPVDHELPEAELAEFAEIRSAERAEVARRSAIAARIVAGHSTDAADCRNLLAMLGLDAEAGKLAGLQT
ncbi:MULTISPECIES: hypothetical protein [Nocardia]|uniref:hypothetical protein n=1 Tax=Nocardia TaxID=1817 RepID=UPI001894B3C1|nr:MULTISPECIES: hypothetical protein [Nocardia]MBF6348016.1 hypothetical protein [Nocardia flavorosea]